MKNLYLLKEVLQEEDYVYMTDLKDAYFSVPLDPNSKEFIRFYWKG